MNNRPNVIIDKKDSDGFDVDWETIEKEYRTRHRRHSRRHRRSSRKNITNASVPQKKKKKLKIFLLGLLIFLIILVLSLTIAFFVLRYIGKQNMTATNFKMSVPDFVEDYKDDGKILQYNGHTYQFNENLSSILFMGIDNTKMEDKTVSGTSGQADALYLLVFNLKTGKLRTLVINRDTMVDINLYDVAGKYVGSKRKQLCLAYAYGDGKKKSVDNQLKSVKRLLYNLPITSYYAIDLSAIKILNDDIGGVTLTPNYTFGSFTKGQSVTLKGNQAEEFVRKRDVTQLDDHLRRIECQKQYITSFANQIVPSIRKDFRVPISLYSDSAQYSNSNMGIPELVFLSSSLATTYSGIEFIGTPGTYKMVQGDTSAEYLLDQKAFFETILDLYYTKID